MIKSMTAYGRASKSSSVGRWIVEIHSVNRRMLDVNIHLPKELLRFDIEFRKWVASNFSRGQVTIRVNVQQEGNAADFFNAQVQPLKDMKAGWEKLASDLGYDAKQAVSLEFLASQLPHFSLRDTLEEDSETLDFLHQLFNEALEQVRSMKEREGNALAADILPRLEVIENSMAGIRLNSGHIVERYRGKLQERIKEVCSAGEECDDRVLREVALFAERQDITEELTRLQSHIDQFRLTVHSKEKSVGRTLDFLSQEMNREINTIGSKASDAEVTKEVISVKSELEKIREQIQNIE